MANPITFERTNLFNIAKVTASSTQVGYDAARLLDWTRPYRGWRASATLSTSDNIVFDLGASFSVAAVILDGINIAAATIQVNATDSWGSPSYTANVVPLLDRYDGRYKLVHAVAGGTGRYVRVKSNTTSTTDGTTTMAIGSVALSPGGLLWGWPVGYPLERSQHRAILGRDSDVAEIGNLFVELRLSQALIEAGSETDFVRTFALGEAEPFWVYLNGSSAGEVYPVRRLGPAPIARTGPNSHGVSGFTLREFE